MTFRADDRTARATRSCFDAGLPLPIEHALVMHLSSGPLPKDVGRAIAIDLTDAAQRPITAHR